ncbi:30S ribosome-binding factor RbfA [Biformimicrobium ophioploci]|uniref:Ribosome-binding factor A n=1 Tax=Biformimicrobium ophioploci TaxID=3036711 RepID=A0ABQ6LWE7_9GAMM|nr:30S ribosome-binding factor RbfA [Microbulbifer sp. NKW57]GMG86417.1 30S ribosome-binding factor RbfA [Microbulbifer sp. NKW57]
MAREFHRTDRIADAMKRELAQLIQNEIRDPRVGMTNVNDVEVSRDLSHAKVYVTFVGEDDAKKIEDGVQVLNRAAGFLRSQLAGSIQMRAMPRLSFRYDETSVRGQQLSALIDKAVAADRKDLDEGEDGQQDDNQEKSQD